jgi:ATP-dependent protease HslVU (ClpYQ) peptidase subunit
MREALCSDEESAASPLLGSATQAAGLFFLLNALRSAGIGPALRACPALAEAWLAIHILKRLATHAGVADSDPILLCLHSPQRDFALDTEVLAVLAGQPHAWPAGFAPSLRAAFDSESFLRMWVLAVRRWCWRAGRLTVREIVERSGRVWQTRTDIDVTLPLADADIRIRRIGLDIDPGWLPWFGVHGRVVRFHYRDREPGGTAC